MKKKGKSMHMCIDYRELNKVTVNKPTAEDDDLFNQLKCDLVFFKIDLRFEYHQILVTEKDISNTTFRTRYKHYKFVAIPFGLTNALTIFMDLRNKVF